MINHQLSNPNTSSELTVINHHTQLPKRLYVLLHRPPAILALPQIQRHQICPLPRLLNLFFVSCASSPSSGKYTIKTSAPSRAISTATERPIPESPPTTNTALPFSNPRPSYSCKQGLPSSVQNSSCVHMAAGSRLESRPRPPSWFCCLSSALEVGGYGSLLPRRCGGRDEAARELLWDSWD